MELSKNAENLLEDRYLRRNEKREIIETPEELFNRVAENIAAAEEDEEKRELYQEKFYELMTEFKFLPNSPTLMNAGTELQQLAACFVLPVPDSMEGIFTAVKNAALIHKSGGGTGFAFSRLRPKNDVVKSTGGISSGPLSFLRVFNRATDTVKQGGKRRGANMGMLRVDHPDILDFINAKGELSKENQELYQEFKESLESTYIAPEKIEVKLKRYKQKLLDRQFSNFNFSVAVTEEFMEAVKEDESYELINPRTGEIVEELEAQKVFNLIVDYAWKNGEPGIIFLDQINQRNPVPNLGEIEATNPCITGDALVATEFGLIRFDELYEKHEDGKIRVLTDDRVNKNIEGTTLNEANKIYQSGKKEVMKLETKAGYEIKATADHKFLTTDGWKELNEINLGDKVLIQSGEGVFSNKESLPFEVRNSYKGNNGRTYNFNLPDRWSKELGQILGWLIGDGWLRKGDKNCRVGFTFGKDDVEVLEYLSPIINGMYDNEIEAIERENGVYHLSYHSKYFVDFFAKLGVKAVKAEDKEIADSIFTAPKEAVVGFLQGLFTADGTVRINEENGDYYVRLTSKSENLLKDVQLLLLNFRIKSSIYDRSRDSRKGVFSYTNKNGEKVSYSSDGVLFELNISKASLEIFAQEINFLTNKKKNLLSKIKNKDLRSDKMVEEVLKIEKLGKELVYDLREDITHSFVANGIVTHNCGEQPLLSNEACNLGSINLAKFVDAEGVKWEELKETTRLAVRFLDNVIDMNNYPIPEIEEEVMKSRKIGLGVMGFHELLIKLGIAYNSSQAVEMAEKVMSFINSNAHQYSQELAEEKGAFPVWEESVYDQPQRNATLTTIAPTGSISFLAGTSGGVEPFFSFSYTHTDGEGNVSSFEYDFTEEAEEEVLVTTMDIESEWHIKIQAAFQEHVDNAVSKTINLPNSATKEDVFASYLMAYELGCKGLTVYRDGSRESQVLNSASESQVEKRDINRIHPKERPLLANGQTVKYDTGCGKMYLTINIEEQGPIETFLTTGSDGGCNVMTEAVSRLTSMALRSGIDAREVIDQLRSTSTCPSFMYQKGKGKKLIGRSCSDVVGRALKEIIEANGFKELSIQLTNKIKDDLIDDDLEQSGESTNNSDCPECGTDLHFEQGCNNCKNCGYSNCG